MDTFLRAAVYIPEEVFNDDQRKTVLITTQEYGEEALSGPLVSDIGKGAQLRLRREPVN